MTNKIKNLSITVTNKMIGMLVVNLEDERTIVISTIDKENNKIYDEHNNEVSDISFEELWSMFEKHIWKKL